MDRKKKKLAASKTAAAVAQQRKAIKERFISRTKAIIEMIGGKELLEKIPAIYIEKSYECRYPSLKAKAAPGSEISKVRAIQFHKLLHQLMEDIEVPINAEHKIPLTWYLSEAKTLIDAISVIDSLNDPDLMEIKAAFEPYLPGSELHYDIQELLAELTLDTCRFLSDYNDHIYRADISMTPYYADFNPQNDILIHTFKPVVEKIESRSGKREAIKLGWANPEFKWENFKVKASKLGFQIKGMDVPLDLYISKHALQRLKERINVTPGIMHEILLLTFLQPHIPHHWNGYESQVEFLLADQKAGYFTVKLHDDKLVIHTFLFLTNNDTPEGEKLNRLLQIEKVDKKYLAIDNLPEFNAYHIDQNEKLSQLFRDAGCGSLLKLGHVQAFTQNEVADKDPESILKYLADAAYFRKQGNTLA